MIGRELRFQEVIEDVKKNQAIFFALVLGAVVLIVRVLKKSEVVACEDISAEAIYRFM